MRPASSSQTALLAVLGVSLGSVNAFAADPCEPLRLRDTAPLTRAIVEDQEMATAFGATATACGVPDSAACDAAKLDCATRLAAVIKSQATFDEGSWLRDMLLPFQGQNYPMTRQFAAAAGAADRSCATDVATLTAASQRRLDQATRRDALMTEYRGYSKWAQDAAARCAAGAAADKAKAEKQRVEAEAAAALAAAEATKQKQALDQRKAAEEAAKKAEEERVAQEAAKKKLAEEAARKQADDAKRLAEEQKKQAEEAKKQAEADRKKAADAEEKARKERVEAEEKARKERVEAEEKARQERADAEEKARREREAAAKAAADAKLVAEREAKKAAAKDQQAQLLAQADAELRAAETDVEKRKKDAMVQADLDAQRRLDDARKRKAALEAQAGNVKIPTDDERSRGAASLAVGGGYSAFSLSSGAYAGPMFGAQLMVHLGFWGVAPAEGLASGFELRLLAHYRDTFSSTEALRSAQGLVTGRYFFGRFGVGLGFDTRYTMTASPAVLDYGVGPSISFAIVDSPRNRINLNAHWLGLLNPNLGHFSADLEFSFSYFTIGINGGDVAAPGRNGYQISGFVGGRLPW